MGRCQESKNKFVKDPKTGFERKQPVLICGLEAQEGSDLCPRHKFLAEIAGKEKVHKDSNREKAQAAGVTGIQPNTRAGLIAKGYQFTGNGSCNKCEAPIEWWKTPAGRSAPFNPMPVAESHALSHFANCKFAAAFRRSA